MDDEVIYPIDTKEVVKQLSDQWNFFMAFIDPDTEDEVMHLVGYQERPNVSDITQAIYELKTDKDFGMDARYVDTLRVRIFQFK